MVKNNTSDLIEKELRDNQLRRLDFLKSLKAQEFQGGLFEEAANTQKMIDRQEASMTAFSDCENR